MPRVPLLLVVLLAVASAALGYAGGRKEAETRLGDALREEVAKSTPACEPVYQVAYPVFDCSLMGLKCSVKTEIYRSTKLEDVLSRATPRTGIGLWEERGGRERQLPLDFKAATR